MAFVREADRSGWKKPRTKRIDAREHDAIIAAIRASPGDLDAIAGRFNLSHSTIAKMAVLALDRRNRP